MITFFEAIEALKAGKCIKKSTWPLDYYLKCLPPRFKSVKYEIDVMEKGSARHPWLPTQFDIFDETWEIIDEPSVTSL